MFFEKKFDVAKREFMFFIVSLQQEMRGFVWWACSVFVVVLVSECPAEYWNQFFECVFSC